MARMGTAVIDTTGRDAAVSQKVERLNTASVKRVIEPEERFAWSEMSDGQVLPDDLLSVADLGLDLTPEQKARLSREEVAAMLSIGVMFESVLTAGFALQIAYGDTVVDPRVTYMLHEIGEESRHSRAFVRVVEQLEPTAKNPMSIGIVRFFERRIVIPLIIGSPAYLAVMILAGEEIPDLLQKLSSEHPDTDRVLAEVNKYHRMEEARHLAFARATLPELYAESGITTKLRIRYMAPFAIKGLFEMFVHPGVYKTIGLPMWRTWRRANRSPSRVAMRHEATRPILAACLDAGIFRPGAIPRGWRKLCGVDEQGQPLVDAPTLSALRAQLA
jgi:hypothetical protein